VISLEKFIPKCELCGSERNILVAHYEEHVERKSFITICRGCHSSIHARIRWGKELRDLPYVLNVSDETYLRLEQLQQVLLHQLGTKIPLKGIAEMAIYRYWKEVKKECVIREK